MEGRGVMRPTPLAGALTVSLGLWALIIWLAAELARAF